MRQENFVEKSSVALGFLSAIIAFLSTLIMTMTWLHCSIPLGWNVIVSSFPLMLSFMIPAATSIVILEYYEVHRYERIPDFHRDIFRNSHWTPDRLIRQL
jgi:purine-cytosine permease-like protein